MKVFLSTDYKIIDSRLAKLLNLEFFNNPITEVITTNSDEDSFIRKLCVAKGIEFKIFDLSYKREVKALELLIHEIDKIILLTGFNNSFYIELFRINEEYLVDKDGSKYSRKQIKNYLLGLYKNKISRGENATLAYDETLGLMNKYSSTEFFIYRKEP